MSETLHMFSTTTTLTTQKTTFTELVERDEQVARVLPLHCSPLRVSLQNQHTRSVANGQLDAKQARDLLQILQEAKQNIDPRLAEMGRYSGGGGGGGRGYGRGGHRGGRGGYHTGGNTAPLGRSRW